MRRMLYPIEKRLPDLASLSSIQSMRNHFYFERVVGPDLGLLAPMVIEQMLAVEAHELADQPLESLIRFGLDLEVGGAEKLWQLVKTHCHPAHHAEGAPSAALQRPEQIGIGA